MKLIFTFSLITPGGLKDAGNVVEVTVTSDVGMGTELLTLTTLSFILEEKRKK